MFNLLDTLQNNINIKPALIDQARQATRITRHFRDEIPR